MDFRFSWKLNTDAAAFDYIRCLEYEIAFHNLESWERQGEQLGLLELIGRVIRDVDRTSPNQYTPLGRSSCISYLDTFDNALVILPELSLV